MNKHEPLPFITTPGTPCPALIRTTSGHSRRAMHVALIDHTGEIHTQCYMAAYSEHDLEILDYDTLDGHYSPKICHNCKPNLDYIAGVTENDFAARRLDPDDDYPDDPQARAHSPEVSD